MQTLNWNAAAGWHSNERLEYKILTFVVNYCGLNGCKVNVHCLQCFSYYDRSVVKRGLADHAGLPFFRSPHCNPDVWPLDGISALLRFALTQSSAASPHQQLSDETQFTCKRVLCAWTPQPGSHHHAFGKTGLSCDRRVAWWIIIRLCFSSTEEENTIKVNSTGGLCCILASNPFSFFLFLYLSAKSLQSRQQLPPNTKPTRFSILDTKICNHVWSPGGGRRAGVQRLGLGMFCGRRRTVALPCQARQAKSIREREGGGEVEN